MSQNKVQPASLGLCGSCEYGVVVETATGKVHIRCHEIGTWLREPVIRCAEYHRRGTPTKHQMTSIAWILNTEKRGGVQVIGFSPPAKKRDDD